MALFPVFTGPGERRLMTAFSQVTSFNFPLTYSFQEQKRSMDLLIVYLYTPTHTLYLNIFKYSREIIIPLTFIKVPNLQIWRIWVLLLYYGRYYDRCHNSLPLPTPTLSLPPSLWPSPLYLRSLANPFTFFHPVPLGPFPATAVSLSHVSVTLFLFWPSVYFVHLISHMNEIKWYLSFIIWLFHLAWYSPSLFMLLQKLRVFSFLWPHGRVWIFYLYVKSAKTGKAVTDYCFIVLKIGA